MDAGWFGKFCLSLEKSSLETPFSVSRLGHFVGRFVGRLRFQYFRLPSLSEDEAQTAGFQEWPIVLASLSSHEKVAIATLLDVHDCQTAAELSLVGDEGRSNISNASCGLDTNSCSVRTRRISNL